MAMNDKKLPSVRHSLDYGNSSLAGDGLKSLTKARNAIRNNAIHNIRQINPSQEESFNHDLSVISHVMSPQIASPLSVRQSDEKNPIKSLSRIQRSWKHARHTRSSAEHQTPGPLNDEDDDVDDLFNTSESHSLPRYFNSRQILDEKSKMMVSSGQFMKAANHKTINFVDSS